MAPGHYIYSGSGPIQRDGFVVRNTGSNAAGGSQSIANPVEGAATAPAAASTTYIGIGTGVGGAILLAIIAVCFQILRKRAQHRRAVTELEEQSQAVAPSREREISEVPRPVSIARCGGLAPLHARAGWGALSSDETVHEPEPVARADERKRNSISLPKRINQRGIPLKRLKHLSAIIESPRSRCAKSPSPAVPDAIATPPKPESAKGCGKKKTVNPVRKSEDDEDVFTAPGSPKPHILPSFAIRSPGMYGAAIANDERPKTPRSVSVGALLGPIPENAVYGHTARVNRPSMHARSISLGAPQSRPPSGPVPPLPVIAPHGEASMENHRQGVCVSRMSSSSQESASSSVLVTSPIIKMQEDGQPLGSPTLEQVIADDDSAQLKSVMNRQWQNPLITGPRPMDEPRLETANATGGAAVPRHNPSIRSNMARYSTNELQRVSSMRTISSIDDDTAALANRLSIPQIATADSVSISRVSSFNSLKAPATSTHKSASGGVQKITTPRKASRQSTVSANGSPAERRKTSVLRDISGNAGPTPSRQASQSTQASGRSSNGNPFQWDQSLPLMKPSALKGSPNSKGSKGHKRQNCVRISTLTPQILGPPPSRATSPSIMHGIEEESADGSGSGSETGMRFVSNHRSSRPSSTGSFAANLRTPALRASLTPSSPTLSAWTAYQEQHASGLPSQHLDSQLSVSPINTNRSASRHSDRSSAFSIPAFPSPSRATVSTVQLEHPVPEFCISRPTTDEVEQESSSPFALHASSCEGDQDASIAFPSSPPLPVSKEIEYDPAWPMLAIPAPDGEGKEYDPASPLWPPEVANEGGEHSSPAFLPFAVDRGNIWQDAAPGSDDVQMSPLSRPSSTTYGGDLPDTPPCSPKSMPEGFKDFFARTEQDDILPVRARAARPTAAEKLTSANASAIMATIPESPPNVGFPSAVPILPPPPEDENPSTTAARRQRAASTSANLQPLRSAPPPPAPMTASEADALPSPLQIRHTSTTSPQGPRSEPAKSVLKNAMALRRMNSEVDQARNTDRALRHYVRVGREASPLLPFVGSPAAGESYNDLFDFDFGSLDANAGAEQQHDQEVMGRSALDDIDFSALDKTLDGALAGFDVPPPSSAETSRQSSVWEDGEKFWSQPEPFQQRPFDGNPEFSFTPSSPTPINVTPVKKRRDWNREDQENIDIVMSDRSGSLTPTQQMMKVLDEAPSSMLKTPRSLYDSDGFLRT